ncbi:MAG: amino acid permease [Gammaproteobacteria bacterium]
MRINKVLSGALLVAGTSIGAVMLVLPLQTSVLGGLGSVAVLSLVLFIMWSSAQLFLEVCLKYPETNVISLVGKLGFPGLQSAVWLFMLIFLYALMSAYTSGGSEFLIKGLSAVGLAQEGSKYFSMLAFVLLFGGLVVLGTRVVDSFNKIAMFILGLSYVSILYIVWWRTQKIGIVWQPEPVLFASKINFFKIVLQTLSVVVTSFGFHLLIPSLSHYLNKKARDLRWAITLGCGLVALVYLSWVLSIFTIIPPTQAFRDSGASAITNYLIQQSPYAALSIAWFSFMALLTSFVGVSLGLVDLLADGLKINKQTKYGKVKLFTLAFIPPLLYTVIHPTGFLQALRYAGIFSAILLIALPAYLHIRTFGVKTKSLVLILIASLLLFA